MSSADLDAVTCLFLDTERADAAGVSLALASEDGVHWFYAERDPLPAMSTEFFRDVAYPILDCGPVAMSNRPWRRVCARSCVSQIRPWYWLASCGNLIEYEPSTAGLP